MVENDLDKVEFEQQSKKGRRTYFQAHPFILYFFWNCAKKLYPGSTESIHI